MDSCFHWSLVELLCELYFCMLLYVLCFSIWWHLPNTLLWSDLKYIGHYWFFSLNQLMRALNLWLFFFKDALPEGFSQQFGEEQQKTRAKFYSPAPPCEMPQVPNNKKKEDNSEKKVFLKPVFQTEKTLIITY